MTASHGESAPPDKRGEVLNRDGYRCQLCDALGKKHGGTAELVAHHKEPSEDGGSHDLDNLITLCTECHSWYHTLDNLSDAGLEFEDVSYEPSASDLCLLMALGRQAPTTTQELSAATGTAQSVVCQRLYKLTTVGVVAPTAPVFGTNSDGQWDFRASVDDPGIGELPDDPKEAARLTRDEMLRQLHASGTSQSQLADDFGVSRRTVIRGITRARALKPPVPAIADNHDSGISPYSDDIDSGSQSEADD